MRVCCIIAFLRANRNWLCRVARVRARAEAELAPRSALACHESAGYHAGARSRSVADTTRTSRWQNSYKLSSNCTRGASTCSTVHDTLV